MNKTERLDILEQAGVITSPVRRITDNFIDKLELSVPIEWEMEMSELFITHLSVAMQRMHNGEPLTHIAEEIRSQLQSSTEAYILLQGILQELQQQGTAIATSEEELLFLCAYIEAIRKEGIG